MGSFYELIANKHKESHWGKLVNSAQIAFVGGRQQMDWVYKMAYLHSLLFVLINGSPTGFFHSSRGLIQGDPLSTNINFAWHGDFLSFGEEGNFGGASLRCEILSGLRINLGKIPFFQ